MSVRVNYLCTLEYLSLFHLECVTSAVVASSRPAIEQVQAGLVKDEQPGIVICVNVSWFLLFFNFLHFLSHQLPVLCVFQTVRYRVVISHGGDPVLQLSRQFSYSSGYTSECIEEKISEELEEGVDYEAQMFLYSGESGNSSSLPVTFSEFNLMYLVEGV